MAKTTGAKLFAEVMHGYGVSHVFFVPAIMLKPLAELERFDIRRIMTHGEKAAAYMADGYARASGRPGVCLAQHIGASNLAAGLRDAYMAGSPVIAFTGSAQPLARYRHGYQEIEDFPQFDPVTKLNARVDDVARLPDLLRQAFRAATSGAPGPVHLELRGPHGEIANLEAELHALIEPQFAQVPAFRPEPEIARVREAAALLARAQKPVIVAGGGVVASRAEAQLVRLAEKLQIPVVTSLDAKAAIPGDHPLAAGVMGTYSRACANRAVYEADLVFFVGSHAGGQLTCNWKIPAEGTAVIQLDIDAQELGRNYPNTVALLGDARVTLERLIDVAQARPATDTQSWLARVRSLVVEWRAEFEPLQNSDAVPMRPERICREISRGLPEHGVVVSDTGHSGMWTGAQIDLTRPGQRYIRCAGSLGWGFPASLGVKCALPDAPVLCFTGDGGLYYHLAELETAARYAINVVVLVNDNSSLNQEIPLFDAAYGGTQSERAGEMWRFRDIDIARVAESLGCAGFRVTRPAELAELLPRAFGMGRPVVIDAVSDERAFARKAWLPEGASSGH